MAMQFVAASSQYLAVPVEFSTLRGTCSLSFWIKTTQVGNDTAYLAPGVTGVEQAGGNDDIMWGIIGADGKIGIDVGLGGDVFNKSTTTINNGNWHFVVITRNSSTGEVKIYVDGSLETTASRGTGTIGNTFWQIGCVRNTGGSPNYLDGQLDDLRIYSRVLTEAEIKCMYWGVGGGDGVVYGLVHHYVFDEFSDGAYDPPATAKGTFRRDYWLGIGGALVTDLTGHTGYPDIPDGTDYWTAFEGPTNWAENYGARMWGWFYPNFTGNHYFALATDDGGQLNLSTDWNPANKVQIASVSSWASPREYNKLAGQISGAIALVTGTPYFIEGLVKESGGGDNIAVAVNNSGVFVNGDTPIQGSQLSPPDAGHGHHGSSARNAVELADVAGFQTPVPQVGSLEETAMSRVFDGQDKVLIEHANTPDYVGDTRYAIEPTLPGGIAYKYLKTVPGTISFKGQTIVTGIVTEMSVAEKAVVDAAELAAAKPARKTWLKFRGDAYTDERYSSDTQEKLHALYMDAFRYRPKRMQYIQPWIDWLDKVNEEVKNKQTTVDAAFTTDAVNTIVLNESSLTSQDPGITIDGANAVVDTGDLQPFIDANAEVTDAASGKKGPFHLMQTLLLREDMYGDAENPLHVPGRSVPVLGGTGWAVDHANRINNLEVIHGKLGWHAQQVQQGLYSRPKDMMIYYGYPNSFNSGVNGWVNEKVAQDLARYGIIVLGDGVEDPSHPDYANTQIIIPRVKALNPQAKIFGYVDTTLVIATFQTKVGQWDALSVHGIFMDKAGYDWGTIRADFNTRVDYVHGRPAANLVFANCWNTDHVLGIANDASFPNTTFNAALASSKLTSNDWILLESCPVNTVAYAGTGNDGYEVKTDWIARVQKAINLRALYGVNFAVSAIILDAHANGQALFNFHFISALMANMDAAGASDVSYGSGSAKGKWWTRPDVNGLGIVWQLYPAIQLDAGDADVYERFVEAATLKVDFSGSGAQVSSITKR